MNSYKIKIMNKLNRKIKKFKKSWNKYIVMYSFLIKKEDKNDRNVKHWFENFFEYENINNYAWELHYIETKTNKTNIVITIVLGRPGLLIGKGGKTIDNITKKLSDFLELPVKIKIIEHNVFGY